MLPKNSSKDLDCEEKQAMFMDMRYKELYKVDEKPFSLDSIELIEKCAENGTWVLVSTLLFPSFWTDMLRKLR